jgi:hypothetical protein
MHKHNALPKVSCYNPFMNNYIKVVKAGVITGALALLLLIYNFINMYGLVSKCPADINIQPNVNIRTCKAFSDWQLINKIGLGLLVIATIILLIGFVSRWFKRSPKLNNKDEAIELLESELRKRRNFNYVTLLEWVEKDKKEHHNVKGRSGTDYQLDFFTSWDNKKLKTIRFWGNIDGGDVSAYRPITSDFIKAPDNTFVGE